MFYWCKFTFSVAQLDYSVLRLFNCVLIIIIVFFYLIAPLNVSVLYYSTACCVIKSSKCLILILVFFFLIYFLIYLFYSSRQLEYSWVQVLHFNIDSFVIPPVQGPITFPRAHWSLLKLCS